MNFGTNAFRHLTAKQIAAKYAQVRAAVLATSYGASFKSEADFDAFCETRLFHDKGIRRERDRLLSAFCQLHLAHTKSTFIPPSQETLAWGGFLGGETVHDTRSADAICEAMLGAAA